MPPFWNRVLPMAAVIAVAAPIAEAAEDIAGLYAAEGRNEDGSSYTGTVQITATGDLTYRVEWNVGTTYSGTGVLQGRLLTVDWGGVAPAIYVLMPDGELHGTWGDGRGLERLEPMN